MHIDARRDAGDGVAKLFQLRFRDASLAAPVIIDRQAEARPVTFQPVGLVGLHILGSVERFFEEVLELFHLRVDLLGGQQALGDEALAIDFARGRKIADDLVHHRLGHRRVIALVVTEAAIAEHVDDDVLGEFLAVFGRHLRGIHHRFRIIAVDVEDRRLDHQGNIRRIGRGARIHRARREADLVVDDEVDRAACAIALQPRQCETLRHHALPRKRSIAVQQQRQLLGPVELAGLTRFRELLGAGPAEHDRVHRFEVRRVRAHREVNRVAIELTVGRGAEVILHIAGAEGARALRRAALELVEDLVIALAHHSGEHVEAAAVRHADDDFVDAERAAALDDLLQRRHGCLAAIQAEAFRARETFVQETLEGFGFDQLAEDRELALAGERNALVRPLDTLLQPGFLGRVGDVHELDAERRTIGPLQDIQHLVDGGALKAEHVVDEDRTVAVLRAEAIGRRVKLGLLAEARQAQGVELRGEMSPNTIGADHHQRTDRISHRLGNVSRGRGGACRLDFLLKLRLERRPVAIEGSNFVTGARLRPAFALPAGALGIRRGACGIVAQFGKEGAPAFRNRGRILRIGRLHLFDVERRSAIKERGLQHRGVTGAARAVHQAAIVCHCNFILPEPAAPGSHMGAGVAACRFRAAAPGLQSQTLLAPADCRRVT